MATCRVSSIHPRRARVSSGEACVAMVVTYTWHAAGLIGSTPRNSRPSLHGRFRRHRRSSDLPGRFAPWSAGCSIKIYDKKLTLLSIKSTASAASTAGWRKPSSELCPTVSLAVRQTRVAAALWRFSQARLKSDIPGVVITTNTMDHSP